MRKTSVLALLAATPAFALPPDPADPLAQLARMSLEQLSNVEVTSVSKTAESLSSAPASIYVITREEILRSGALSVPEVLRLAPNLQVAQLSATDYAVGARGFGGNYEAQNFPNKILILVDGRSAYNPLFSGITYDQIDVVLSDLERIEVISGPGATLWGANAMNGVINIITRTAADSRGGLVRANYGNQESALVTRYGGALGANGAYRVYAKGFDRGPTELPDGTSSGDRWHKVQGGFRADLGAGPSAFTFQGDLQQATLNKAAAEEVDFTQFNVLGRWEHAGERIATRLQVYYDHIDRDRPPEGIAFEIDTWDVELQQSATLGTRHRVVWGLGKRFNAYDIENTPTLFFEPPSRTLEITNLFAQDTITLSEKVKLTAGIKFEENSYSGWSVLPDLRLAWSPAEHATVWAAAARAVRAPTPFDTEVRESFGGPTLLFGDPDFEPEKVTAYELGYRSQPHSSISWSISAFYNDYDDLRTVEITPVTFFPLSWANLMEGSTYGVELWANWQVTPWWRLSPGFRSLHKRLRFSEGASEILGTQQAGNDPRSQGSLKSSMDFGRFKFDIIARHVGELPSPATPDYTELSARFAYSVSDRLELSLSGFNLLDDRHLEYAAPTGHEIRRSVHGEIRWQF